MNISDLITGDLILLPGKDIIVSKKKLLRQKLFGEISFMNGIIQKNVQK